MTSSTKPGIQSKEIGHPGDSLPELIYLHELTAEKTVPKLELGQIPFPVSKLRLFPHDDMILECVEEKWYLRSRVESLLVIPVELNHIKLEQQHFTDVELEIQDSWGVYFLEAKFFGQNFLVAWLPGLDKPPITFLPATQFEGSFGNLPRELHLAYRAADRNRRGYTSKSYRRYVDCVVSKEITPKAIFNKELFDQMAKEQAEIHRLRQRWSEPRSSHEPIGPWEQSIEQDIFGGNPNEMTDDEFEMVYGHPR